MAVFMINICKFNGCGRTFQSLGELIWHIEDKHIEFDQDDFEHKDQHQMQCMPLSYILPYFTDAARRDHKPKHIQADLPKVALPPKASSPSLPTVRVQPSTPTGSEVDDDDLMSDLEDSNDSWTTQEEFSSDFILHYGSKISAPSSPGPNGINLEKPFACPVPGCKKRYKNVNGIKYHSKNGHKRDGRVRKTYKCHCGKSYKSGSGLKSHISLVHNGSVMTNVTLTSQGGELLQVPTSQVATIQPVRALTFKHITSIGVPVKALVMATKPPRPISPSSSLGVLTPANSPQPNDSLLA